MHPHDSTRAPPKPPKLSATTSYGPEIYPDEHSTPKIPQHRPEVALRSTNPVLDNNSRPANHRLDNAARSTPEPLEEKVRQSDSKPTISPTPQRRRTMDPPRPHRSVENLYHSPVVSPVPPQSVLRKERRSESLAHSPHVADMTVKSGDPTIHIINRKPSVKKNNRRSVSSSSIVYHEDTSRSNASPKSSPTNPFNQRETEFSAAERVGPAAVDRLDSQLLSNVIHENRPKPVPFDRYNPGQARTAGGSPFPSQSHSRQASNELLDLTVAPSITPRHIGGSPLATPPPRSPGISPPAHRSTRESLARYVIAHRRCGLNHVVTHSNE